MKRQIKKIVELTASRFGPHRRSTSSPRLWVLMYHRILPADDPRYGAEEPGMIVTPDSFRQHLRIIKNRFELLPLSSWIERRNSGKPLPPRACAVTFDDGWLDNFEYALPILQRENVPATLFAVAQMMGTSREFWPNRLSRVLNTPHSSGDLPWLTGIENHTSGQPLSREVVASAIHQSKALSDDELSARLDEAEQRLNIASQSQPALMSWDQLRAMQQSGLVEIGSHTCNHRRLVAGLDSAQVTREVVDSKIILEAQLEKPVDLFCYPNGDVSPEALRLVSKHYKAAVTTQRGINTQATLPHELLRIGIHEDVSSTPTKFEARLSTWI